jgi:hypothetical protein
MIKYYAILISAITINFIFGSCCCTIISYSPEPEELKWGVIAVALIVILALNGFALYILRKKYSASIVGYIIFAAIFPILVSSWLLFLEIIGGYLAGV